MTISYYKIIINIPIIISFSRFSYIIYSINNNIVRNFRDSTDEDYATKDYCLKTTLGKMAEDATIKYANDNNLDAKDLLS